MCGRHRLSRRKHDRELGARARFATRSRNRDQREVQRDVCCWNRRCLGKHHRIDGAFGKVVLSDCEVENPTEEVFDMAIVGGPSLSSRFYRGWGGGAVMLSKHAFRFRNTRPVMQRTI